jgi:predicted Zn-dependent protease with MMP-like domain
MTGWSDRSAPSVDDVAAIAKQAYAALPEPFRKLAGEILVRIEDFASDDVLEDLDIDDPFELTGLYQGVDLSRRSSFDVATSHSVVFLYRRPILDEWTERGDVTLGELITHVLVHEIGHHFGLSDEAMEAIEAAAE